MPKFNEDLCQALPQAGLAIVCDGIGGRSGNGLRAAETAVEKVIAQIGNKILEVETQKQQLLISKESRKVYLQNLDRVVQEISSDIRTLSQDPSLAGVCTSLDILLWQETHLFVAHVGAGRVYLVRKGESYQLTEDHTYHAHLKRIGQLEAVPETERPGLVRRLTRAVGFEENVRVDLMEVEVQEGDRFFAVTDGAWLPIGDERMEGLIAAQLEQPA